MPAKKTVRFVVGEKGEETEAMGVHNASREQLRVWVEGRYIDRKTCEALEGCAALWERPRRSCAG
ncbi:MAG: hypothetical protein ACT4P4_30015 [Betaproteobacteria bacterium]